MNIKNDIKCCQNVSTGLLDSFNPAMPAGRLFAIQMRRSRWMNGTKIHYYFLGGDRDERIAVRNGFKLWKDVGIGISFIETTSQSKSMLRIAFNKGQGSWSYVGRDNLNIPKTQPTMNFGWDITGSGHNGFDTVLHEIGHAIGFAHEHQNPKAGIRWNVNNVIKEFSGPPNNWNRSTITNNILRQIPMNEVQGSSWDADSIMHYPFGPGLINSPSEYRNGVFPKPGLSETDIATVKNLYPGEEDPSPNEEFDTIQPGYYILNGAKAGDQLNYKLGSKFADGEYQFLTIGKADTLMILEHGDVTIEGDDDSGFDSNAGFSSLIKRAGHEYNLKIRIMSINSSIAPSIIIQKVV